MQIHRLNHIMPASYCVVIRARTAVDLLTGPIESCVPFFVLLRFRFERH